MAYSHELIGDIGVDDESNGGRPLNIGVGVDSLGMCTISFGTAYSIRIPEADVDKLRDILHDASRKMNWQRHERKMEAAMERRRRHRTVKM
jgi:hypothetical protein